RPAPCFIPSTAPASPGSLSGAGRCITPRMIDPDAQARRELARHRAFATLLLCLMGVLPLASFWLPQGWWSDLLQAAAKAGFVGGIADWFAVTALFRHPLGLPIPHTAIIVERKDQFAATLGQFVQENFLNGDVLAERIRSARLVPRLAGWLGGGGGAVGFSCGAAGLG